MKRRRRGPWRLPPAALAGALLFFAGAARAAPAEGDAATRAQQLFQEGREAMRQGAYPRACPKFRASFALQAALGALLNLAVCEEKVGHLLQAKQHYREFVARAPIDDERRAIVDGYLQALETRLPRLVVKLGPNTPSDVSVELDGKALSPGELEHALVVDPGSHRLSVVAPMRRRELTFEVSERQSVVQVIDFDQPLRAPERAPSPVRRELRRPVDSVPPAEPVTSPLAYWAAGVGVAGIAIGAVTGIMALGKKQTVNEHCTEKPGRTECDLEGHEAIADGNQLATVSSVASVIGVVGLGAGAYLYFSSGASPSTGAPATSSKVPVALGFGFEGRW